MKDFSSQSIDIVTSSAQQWNDSRNPCRGCSAQMKSKITRNV